jgi:hypothetical protein
VTLILFRVDATSYVHQLDFNKRILILKMQGTNIKKKSQHIFKTLIGRKVTWIGHVLHRHCLLKHVIEVKIERRIDMIERQEDTKSYWMTLWKRNST